LQFYDRNHHIWNDLGVVWLKIGKLEQAEQSIQKAIEIDNSISSYHYNLGLIREKQGDIDNAIKCYQNVIELEPKFVDAYNNLGNIFKGLGDLDKAYWIYDRAIFINPEHFGSYLNLGNIFMAQKKFAQAIQNYTKALKLQSENPEVFYNLGLAFEANKEQELGSLNFGFAYYYQKNFSKAIVKFEEYFSKNIGDINFYLCFAKSYRNLNEEKKALAIYTEGIKNHSQEFDLYISFISTHVICGKIDQAIYESEKLCKLFPDSIAFKWLNCRIIPMIYSHQEEISIYRQRYTEKLKQVTLEIKWDSEEIKKESLSEILTNTNYNFFIQYQGKNDLELQKIYGDYVHQVMSVNYPQWVQPIPQDILIKNSIVKRKIRIGYISKNLTDHTVGNLFAGWLRHHNQEKFQIYSYLIDNIETAGTQSFKIFSDSFHKISNDIEKICEQILADHLDVLVFLDIGMDEIITCISSLRLAPIQCMTWGHPITSGSPTIDYFLSSELMETQDSQNYYNEELVLLPNISISYPVPTLPREQENR